jgi:hypothetical protein
MRHHQSFALKVGAAAVVVAALLVGSSTTLAASPRSGTLNMVGDCIPSSFAYCTVVTSNLAEIPLGSKLVFVDPVGLFTEAGTAAVLDPPAPGNNFAFGRCVFTTLPGRCEFSDGTGRFTWFQASFAIAEDGFVEPEHRELFELVGTYSFSPH